MPEVTILAANDNKLLRFHILGPECAYIRLGILMKVSEEYHDNYLSLSYA